MLNALTTYTKPYTTYKIYLQCRIVFYVIFESVNFNAVDCLICKIVPG